MQNLKDEQKRLIEERVNIDLLLGNIYRGRGAVLPNKHYDYILMLGISLLGIHDIWSNNSRAYEYMRNLIWEDNFEELD